MSRVIKSPAKFKAGREDGERVFLAGSIENGKAEEWQEVVEKALEDTNLVLFNPRRDDWDSTLVPNLDNKVFRDQVKWERKYLKEADYYLFYFDPKTTSPVTLLELGEFGSMQNDNVIVVCPKDYYRRGNVEAFCDDNNIDIFETLEEGIEELIEITCVNDDY